MSGIDDFVKGVKYETKEIEKYLAFVDEWSNGFRIYKRKDELYVFKPRNDGYEMISAWDVREQK